LKQTKEALKESMIFLKAIISNSPVAISVRKATGELLFVNEAWKKFWKISSIPLPTGLRPPVLALLSTLEISRSFLGEKTPTFPGAQSPLEKKP